LKKEKEDKGKEKGKETTDGKEKDKEESEAKAAPKSPPPPATPPPPPTSTHNKYTLQRHLFAARQLEHRKRRQIKEAREVAPRLPGVPGGALGP